MCIYVKIPLRAGAPTRSAGAFLFPFFFGRMCVVIYYSSRCIYVSWYCCIYMCLVTAALELKASDSSSLRPRTLVASGLIH